MRWINRLIAVAIAFVLGIFAVVNRDPVLVRFWPLPETVMLPTSVAILIGGAIGFLLGAIVMWGPAWAARSRARAAEDRLRVLAPPPPPEPPARTALAAPR